MAAFSPGLFWLGQRRDGAIGEGGFHDLFVADQTIAAIQPKLDVK
jgi:hypothetical protein